MVTAVVIITVIVYHVWIILKVSVNSITIIIIIIIIIGGNCQRCKHGFYGNPVNGGNCSGKNYLFQVDL